jgi:hypothetical protein
MSRAFPRPQFLRSVTASFLASHFSFSQGTPLLAGRQEESFHSQPRYIDYQRPSPSRGLDRQIQIRNQALQLQLRLPSFTDAKITSGAFNFSG